jgi:putative molybdopterin biosynthesis protein
VILLDTLTPLSVEEAAKILKISKYTLYELIKRGEIPAQRIGRQIRIDPHVVYQFSSIDNKKSLVKQIENSSPQGPKGNMDNSPESITSQGLHFIGSHDPIIELLADFWKHSLAPANFSFEFKGSMDGLLALYKKEAQICGIHLWDDKTGAYNIPFVHYVLSGEQVVVINLVQRVQGLIVQPGNPLKLQTWEDLLKNDVRFINRQRGSGTRLRIDSYLRSAGISPARLRGYEQEEKTHFDLAFCVANGQADVGIGVHSAAHRMGLDFVPLFKERYDLVVLQDISETEVFKHLLSILNSSAFQVAVQRQIGYDTSLTGKLMT